MIDSLFSWVVEHWFILAALVALLLVALSGLRLIPNNKVGVVENRVSRRGSLKTGLMALDGEAGFQPALLRGGLHFLMPLQYRVHTLPLVAIPQGKIGYVFARDGAPLPASQTLATNVTAADFQDVRAFLAVPKIVIGGQAGQNSAQNGVNGNVMGGPARDAPERQSRQ